MTDAIVVGSGPNGLAAAITLARAGVSVRVLERGDTVGGGMRSAELTLPGFTHDVCSAIHPLALASPFFTSVPLEEHDVRWIAPPTPLAHPFDDGTAAVLEQSLAATCDALGVDGGRYRRLMGPLVPDASRIVADLLGPLRLPRDPLGLARFGARGALPASTLARVAFKTERARGLFAGLAAHSMLPLSSPATAGYGLTLALLGHAVGWPLVEGGSQRLAEALVSYLRALGGEIETGHEVTSLAELGDAKAIVLDTGPHQLAQLAGDRLPSLYRRRLEGFRYGPGVFKLDWALDGPIPWQAPECARTATVHLGPTLREIALSERAPSRGEIASVPYVLLAQQSLFDPTRAPAGKQVAWAYCHVPNGSRVDMTDAIERQVERFAPGFRELILARSAMGPADMQRHNPNYVGGDINGGAGDVRQLFTRPVARLNPYTTPLPGVFIGSSSTPPGGGVHGMCGVFAARAALKHLGVE